MRRLALTAALLAGALSLPAGAQAQFAGKWTFEFGEWQTDDGANIQIRGATSGVLELTVKGDSAIGKWTGTGTNAPLDIRGRIEGNKLVAKGSREGRVNVNGEESTVTTTITFELTAASGELSGVMRLAAPVGPPVFRSANEFSARAQA
jgi:hypothetical protein